MKKINFNTKNAKALRTIANTEHKGMNAAIRTLKGVWDANNTDLTESIEAAKNDGLTIDDFSPAYIIKHLTGTKWVNNGAIMTNKKGEMVPKSTWTPGSVVDYVRKANKARIDAENKAEKEREELKKLAEAQKKSNK